MVEDFSEKNAEKQEIPSNKRYGLGVRHVQTLAMCMAILALYSARSSMGVAVLAMTDHTRIKDGLDIYKWDKKIQGYILSAFFSGYALMQIPAGLLAKRYGGKPMLFVALFGNGFLSFAMPYMAKVGDWPLVCLTRALMGVTQAFTFPSMHTMLGRWLPAHEVTTISGLVYGSTNLGVILSSPISGVLAETALGWKMIFYFCGVLLLSTSALWWWLAASSPGEHRMIKAVETEYIEKNMSKSKNMSSLNIPWKGIVCCRGFWAIVISNSAFVISYIFFFVDLPTYLEKGLNISLKDSALLSALPYVGNWVGVILATNLCDLFVNNGWLSLGFCRKLFTSIGLFGTAFLLFILSLLDKESKMLAIIVLITLFTLQSFVFAGCAINHLDLSPNYAGVMVSLSNGIANIGSFLTPIVTSVILRNDPTNISHWRVVFFIVASLCVVANVIFLIIGTAEKQPWDDPAYMDKKECHPEEMVAVLEKGKNGAVDGENEGQQYKF